MGDQSSQKPVDQSPRSMFTLFTVRVLRASTHLQSLVHFLGIYQFDSVTFSLLYFLSGPTKYLSIYLKIFSLQIFLTNSNHWDPLQASPPWRQVSYLSAKFQSYLNAGPNTDCLPLHKVKMGKIFKTENFVSAERNCSLCSAQATYTQQVYPLIYYFAFFH